MEFSEPVTGFASDDVTIGGTAGAITKTVTGSGTTYNVAVSGMTKDGTVDITVRTAAADDQAGNSSLAPIYTDNSITYDTTPPPVTVELAQDQTDVTSADTVNFKVTFSEPVTDFTKDDVAVGGTAGAMTATVSGSGTTYNVAVTGMNQGGTVVITVGAGVAHDQAGNPNLPAANIDNSVTYVPPQGGSAYTPQQILTAYGIESTLPDSLIGDGTGQTIAIIVAYDNPNLVSSTDPGFASSDLALFNAYFGLSGFGSPDPSGSLPTFLKLNQNGIATPLPGVDPDAATNPTSNWEIEAAMDVEWRTPSRRWPTSCWSKPIPPRTPTQ